MCAPFCRPTASVTWTFDWIRHSTENSRRPLASNNAHVAYSIIRPLKELKDFRLAPVPAGGGNSDAAL